MGISFLLLVFLLLAVERQALGIVAVFVGIPFLLAVLLLVLRLQLLLRSSSTRNRFLSNRLLHRFLPFPVSLSLSLALSPALSLRGKRREQSRAL